MSEVGTALDHLNTLGNQKEGLCEDMKNGLPEKDWNTEEFFLCPAGRYGWYIRGLKWDRAKQPIFNLPPEHCGQPIIGILSSVFSGNPHTQKIVVPEGIETIGEFCFYDMPKIEDIYLPTTLKQVGYLAFHKVPRVHYSGDLDTSKWGAYEIIRED